MMVPFQYRRLSVVMFAALLAQPTWAREESSEQNYFQEFPVVLSASRLSQPQSEAPNAMTVIDRKMIEASGFRNIADLFKLVPGMYVSYYKGNQPVVSYHGATDQYARRMQVMIDGRSVYLPPVSMVDWTNLPITIDDIERIEVIRGPAAASHGANSLQGVISIITKDASQMNGKSVSMRRGTHGINDVSAHFGEQGETFDYRMTVAYNADNGYNNLTTMPNNIPPVGGAQLMLNNSYDSNQARMVNFRTNYRPNGVDSFDVQMGFNHDTQVAGWKDSFGNPVHDVIANAGFMQLDWNRVLNASSELRLRYYHVKQSQGEDFVLATGHRVVQSNNTDRDEIEVQHTLQTGEGNRLVYGAGWRRDAISADGYSLAMTALFALPASYASSFASDEYRIFAHDEWRISPQLLLNTGAMFEIDRMGHQRLSPRVAMNYHLAPTQTIRMGASVAYRTPAVIEENYQTIPQPGLLFVPSQTVTSPGLIPEKVLSREIGYLGEFHDLEATLDVRLFVDEITKGILISPATGMFTNSVSSLYRGVETTLKYSLDERKDLIFNFSHQSASSDVTPIGTLSRSIPKNSASLLYSQRLSHNWSFNASYYYQDMVQPYDRGPIDFQPSQRRADIRLGRKFALGKGTEGEAALIVQNLFDEQYTEYVANNAFNRRSYLTLTLDW
ncbi:MAG: TonB-dependent receptor [Gallionella sp.]|nr:TonB-dependent receptor [Gallionella sp.]